MISLSYIGVVSQPALQYGTDNAHKQNQNQAKKIHSFQIWGYLPGLYTVNIPDWHT